MTTERFGWFNADSEHANFLAAYDFDPNAYPHFVEMHAALEKLVLEEANGSYLIWADSKTMEQDEDEFDKSNDAYYGIEPDELDEGSAPALPANELDAFTLLARELFEEAAYEKLSDARLAAAVADFQARATDADGKKAANTAIANGELVHLRAPSTLGYPDASPVAFNKGQHDARTVLKDSDVDYSRGKGALTIHPLPPHLAKKSGKYWGEFKDGSSKAYFMGETKRGLEAKASIYLAWVDKFGADA